MAPKYKLTYFPIKALGEPIRWMLAYGNIEYEDNRINRADWLTKLKPTMPFGQMPLLEVDGKRLNQHLTICRYLARKLNLVGKDDWEAAEIDAIVETFQDFRAPLHQYFYDQNPETKAAKLGPIQKETVPFYLGKFEERLKNNGGFFVGKQITWADIYFISMGEYLQKMSECDFFTNYPHLRALRDKISSIPQLKKWIETRPADVN